MTAYSASSRRKVKLLCHDLFRRKLKSVLWNYPGFVERNSHMTGMRILLALSVLAALALVAGCVSYSSPTPLVQFGDQGYGSSSPQTTAASGDSDQVRQLKDYAAKLQQDLDQEKSRRKADEKKIDQLQNQIKDLQKQLAKANR
jgi:uncharacterized protein HemX